MHILLIVLIVSMNSLSFFILFDSFALVFVFLCVQIPIFSIVFDEDDVIKEILNYYCLICLDIFGSFRDVFGNFMGIFVSFIDTFENY